MPFSCCERFDDDLLIFVGDKETDCQRESREDKTVQHQMREYLTLFIVCANVFHMTSASACMILAVFLN